jgi:hypothetical protein
MTSIPGLRELPRIMLGVAYTLLVAWVNEGDAEREKSDAVQLR